MMYKMGPCQINQPRKTNPAKILLCSQGLAQRSVSAGKPANLSSGSSVAASQRERRRPQKTGRDEVGPSSLALPSEPIYKVERTGGLLTL